MIKQIISILFLVLLPGSLLACDCNSRPLLDYFAESGFVAKIRITKIVPDPQKGINVQHQREGKHRLGGICYKR
jgi:hypothetical protein